MIVQIDKTLFVTPNSGCKACDGTGAVWIDREVNAADECGCITRQIDEHENPFAHYEVIDASHKLYAALKQIEELEEELQRERNRIEALRYRNNYKALKATGVIV